MNLPLTASDLHEIADALDQIETLPAVVENRLLGRIEVLRPGGDHTDVIGYFQQADPTAVEGLGERWIGFVAKGTQ